MEGGRYHPAVYRVGLIVGLQGNGKITQDAAYDEIKKLWRELGLSRSNLFEG